MLYISAQPDSLRFAWELRVQLTNFKKVGVDLNSVHVLFSRYGEVTEYAQKLCMDFPEAHFFFYEDKRIDKSYIPSLKPCLFAQHLDRFPLLENEDFFYYDSDIIFRELPDFSKLLSELGENEWCGSETGHYLNTPYIKSKGEGLLEEMCEEIGIKSEVIEENYNVHVPGAQWIVRKPTAKYWWKVMEDSEKLYRLMKITIEKYKGIALQSGLIKDEKDYQPIQAWTAEMWSQAWNLFLFGYAARVEKELEFCWATDHINRWDQTKIMHNAGVMANNKDLFFKGAFFNKDPFNEDFEYVNKQRCSSKYVEHILEAAF